MLMRFGFGSRGFRSWVPRESALGGRVGSLRWHSLWAVGGRREGARRGCRKPISGRSVEGEDCQVGVVCGCCC
jgi:hypothetical protein